MDLSPFYLHALIGPLAEKDNKLDHNQRCNFELNLF